MNQSDVAAVEKEPASPPEPDEDLLVFIGMKSDCPEDARTAWEKFYCRHREYVFNLAKCFYPRRDEDSYESLMLETFTMVWERASKFKTNGITDPTRISKRVRGWLGFQLKNAFAKLFNLGENTFDDDFWKMQDGKETQSSAPGTKAVEMSKALAALDERERSVVLTTANYYDRDHPKKHLPDSVLQALADEWDTTTENIRQIRRRAFKKLRDQVGSVIKLN